MIYGKMPVLFLSAVFSEKNGSINNTVAQYILEHQDLVREMGITDLAQVCHVSLSSISRFLRKSGWTALPNFGNWYKITIWYLNATPSPPNKRSHCQHRKENYRQY